MELDRLPWWVWTLISIPLGMLLGYMNTGSPEPSGPMRTDRQDDFELAILHAPVKQERIPWVTNLVVYPPIDALGPGDAPIKLMPVTYDALELKRDGAPDEYQPMTCWFRASVPYQTCLGKSFYDQFYPPPENPGLPPGIEKTYVPQADQTIGQITAAVYGKDTPDGRAALTMANKPLQTLSPKRTLQTLIDAGRFNVGRALLVPWNPDKNLTVRDWLTAAAKDHPWVQFRYAWWKEPRLATAVWTSGTFVVVGVLWPILITLLIGAGLSERRGQAEEDFDISRFGRGRPEPAKAAAKKEIGQDELDKVAAMNQSLTESLKDGLGERQAPEAAPAAAANAPAVPKPFVPPPTEAAAPPMPAAPEEQKEYQGEFYPVVRPSEKHHDPKDGH